MHPGSNTLLLDGGRPTKSTVRRYYAKVLYEGTVQRYCTFTRGTWGGGAPLFPLALGPEKSTVSRYCAAILYLNKGNMGRWCPALLLDGAPFADSAPHKDLPHQLGVLGVADVILADVPLHSDSGSHNGYSDKLQ